MGKCPDCGTWDALREYKPAKADVSAGRFGEPGGGGRPSGGDARVGLGVGGASEAVPIGEAGDAADGPVGSRISTSIGELDRVLGGTVVEGDPSLPGGGGSVGGGLVPGSVVLLGGDPGIGKSTLLLQAAMGVARRGRPVLYVSSEESAGQLRRRASRLAAAGGGSQDGGEASDDANASLPTNLYVLADTHLGRMLEQSRKVQPALLIVDSIQMVYHGELPAAPGSVTQVRACGQAFVHHAKTTGTAVALVGHVTKQGALAGPKLLEHMVDAVLAFEGDRYHAHRVVRATKNRFGATLEVGLFAMTGRGLEEVTDGGRLLAENYRSRPGSVACPLLTGTRCLLVELQALTATGFLGSAKRKTSGLDGSRLAMLIAVLEKHGGLRLADQDVFASSVGGVRVAEPAADLPLALAIAGAHLGRSLGERVAAVGELGLGGELRHVQQAERRVREAVRLGFKTVICPAPAPQGLGRSVQPVKNLSQAIEALG